MLIKFGGTPDSIQAALSELRAEGFGIVRTSVYRYRPRT